MRLYKETRAYNTRRQGQLLRIPLLLLTMILLLCSSLTLSVSAEPQPSQASEKPDDELSDNSAFNEEGFDDNSTENNQLGQWNYVTRLDPFENGGQYEAVLYNNTNGLPTSEANAIAQTDDGFIWIGSYGGLVRCDGRRFDSIALDKTMSGVKSLLTDSRSRLWIGSSSNGLAMMEQGQLRYWFEADGLPSGSIDTIAEDKGGTIYIGTHSGLMTVNTEMKLAFIEDDRIKNAYIVDMKKSADGKIYCLDNKNDVFIIDNGKLTQFRHFDTLYTSYSCLLPDPDKPDYVYLGLDSFVHHVSIAQSNSQPESAWLENQSYIQRMEFIDGKIWICSGTGIGSFEPESVDRQLHEAVLKNVPLTDAVAGMLKDFQGNLWFISTRQGVMKVVPNRFCNLFGQYDLADEVVNTTCLYDNKLFIGTDKRLLVLDKSNVLLTYPVKARHQGKSPENEAMDLVNDLNRIRIRSIVRDSRERLWISTWGEGVICLDKGFFRLYNIADGLISSNIRTVAEGRDNTYYAVGSGGVSVIHNETVIKTYGTADGITNSSILTAVVGRNGDLILGSDGDGLYIVNSKGIRHIGSGDGLSSGIVMRIKKDRTRPLYWLVTNNSLFYMTEDYKIFTVSSFPYSNSFDLYQNSRDEMWVLSSKGVFIVPTEQLLSDNAAEPAVYTTANGLPCVATANSYSEADNDGNLYIAGSTGVIKVNIEAEATDKVSYKAAVPYIDADGERIFPEEDGSFHLTSHARKLTIHGHVMNFSLTMPQISYQLEGFDSHNTTVSFAEMGPVDYTNLPGGDYTFVLSVTDSRGNIYNTVTVHIHKEKAFYEQVWFYIILGLLVLLSFILIARFIWMRRLKRLRKKHREEVERERIATELKTACDIQKDMLPGVFPKHKEFDIYAEMSPAKEVGGDFYDYFMMDDDHLCLMIADVSGKGIPAALFMMRSMIILQDFAKISRSPDEILTLANNSVCASNQSEMFVSVWLGIWELSTGILRAANAGHEYPALRKPDGHFELFKDKHGIVIGNIEGYRYKEYELTLEPGSRLFLYTDGVPEATNAEEELFGTDRMLTALNEAPDAPPEQLLSNVRKTVDGFVRDAEQFDDLTMLCIDIKSHTEADPDEK